MFISGVSLRVCESWSLGDLACLLKKASDISPSIASLIPCSTVFSAFQPCESDDCPWPARWNVRKLTRRYCGSMNFALDEWLAEALATL